MVPTVLLICNITMVVLVLSNCSKGQLIILTDVRITLIQLPFPHRALQLEFQQFSKNTGTCAFKLNLLTLWPVTPPCSCQFWGPNAAGSTLFLGQHPVRGGWSGFYYSEMIWMITETLQVDIWFLPSFLFFLKKKKFFWRCQVLHSWWPHGSWPTKLMGKPHLEGSFSCKYRSLNPFQVTALLLHLFLGRTESSTTS